MTNEEALEQLEREYPDFSAYLESRVALLDYDFKSAGRIISTVYTKGLYDGIKYARENSSKEGFLPPL